MHRPPEEGSRPHHAAIAARARRRGHRINRREPAPAWRMFGSINSVPSLAIRAVARCGETGPAGLIATGLFDWPPVRGDGCYRRVADTRCPRIDRPLVSAKQSFEKTNLLRPPHLVTAGCRHDTPQRRWPLTATHISPSGRNVFGRVKFEIAVATVCAGSARW
jgi:hypothetical protein